jgi:hypothetical protein
MDVLKNYRGWEAETQIEMGPARLRAALGRRPGQQGTIFSRPWVTRLVALRESTTSMAVRTMAS